ncbi:hypothetical protein VU07_03540, partial [Desulfobulbus sp. F4]|nr:hypothetical protein [Desulfobulbus sp. F3]MCW5200864.1 hypothetical protein [Desulfobulbus sp. F4]
MNKVEFYSFFAILSIFMVTLMIGPRIPDDQQRKYCIHNIYINNIFGFSLNCDSPDFIILANNPGKLLEKNNVRQDRPGFVLFASLIRFSVSLLQPEAEGYAKLRIGRNTKFIEMEYIYIYFYYILMNILFVLTSFFLYVKLFDESCRKIWAIFFIGLLFIYNDITKAFTWSPHTQIFNIFVPLFCLWCFIEVADRRMFERPVIFIVSVLAGLGVTAYASFFLFLPAIIIPAMTTQKLSQPAATVRFMLRSTIVILLVILPSVLWYFYVLSKTGSFYSHSKEAYHHVVWMKDVYRHGLVALASQLAGNFLILLWFTMTQSWILPLVLLPFVVGRSDKINMIQWREVLLSSKVIGSIFISIMFLAFFAMVGLTDPRVAYSAVPSLIVLTGHIVQNIEKGSNSLAQRLVPIIIFSYGIYELVKDGPYS